MTACRRPVPTHPPSTPSSIGHSVHLTVTVPTAASSSPAPATPSPAYPGVYSTTPTPNPTPIGYSAHTAIETYVVRSGQTLSWIAAQFGCTVEELVAVNNLSDANSIAVGQVLLIPIAAEQIGPATKLLPDSELVYGPAYIHFDLAGFVSEKGGYLAGYSELVEGGWRSGSEIIQLVAERFSVGPRVLLALLELRSGWVTHPQPSPETLDFPLGYIPNSSPGLFAQLNWAAARLNEGYYGWKNGSRTTLRLSDGTRVAIAPELNPGSAAVQNCLAEIASSWDEWSALVGPEGFSATYDRLFGNPFAYGIEPLVPPGIVQPSLWLPWEAGRTWYLTSGPHGGWSNDGSSAALDFAPSEVHLGCAPSADWATAAADGLVVRSGDGQVILDLDGDGFEQSGWVLVYLHIDAQDRVPAGTYLRRGERVGHPSCEGGFSEATHLHFARRYNGEWIAAGSGPLPMVLSGWTAQAGPAAYEGTMARNGEIRSACECWDDAVNGLRSDNAP